MQKLWSEQPARRTAEHTLTTARFEEEVEPRAPSTPKLLPAHPSRRHLRQVLDLFLALPASVLGRASLPYQLSALLLEGPQGLLGSRAQTRLVLLTLVLVPRIELRELQAMRLLAQRPLLAPLRELRTHPLHGHLERPVALHEQRVVLEVRHPRPTKPVDRPNRIDRICTRRGTHHSRAHGGRRRQDRHQPISCQAAVLVAAQAVGARRRPAADDGVGMPSEANEAALRRACREEVEGRHRG